MNQKFDRVDTHRTKKISNAAEGILKNGVEPLGCKECFLSWYAPENGELQILLNKLGKNYEFRTKISYFRDGL